MEKKVKKLKLKIEALNVIKDVDQEKVVGGDVGEASGTGPTFPCDPPEPLSIWACTHTEASGCVMCP